MNGIQRIESPPPNEGHTNLRNIFFDIERKARLSGNAAILMELDRVPGLVLGPENQVPGRAEEMALEQAGATLEMILDLLEKQKSPAA